jgi:hypothetical protein
MSRASLNIVDSDQAGRVGDVGEHPQAQGDRLRRGRVVARLRARCAAVVAVVAAGGGEEEQRQQEGDEEARSSMHGDEFSPTFPSKSMEKT